MESLDLLLYPTSLCMLFSCGWIKQTSYGDISWRPAYTTPLTPSMKKGKLNLRGQFKRKLTVVKKRWRSWATSPVSTEMGDNSITLPWHYGFIPNLNSVVTMWGIRSVTTMWTHSVGETAIRSPEYPARFRRLPSQVETTFLRSLFEVCWSVKTAHLR